MIFILKWQQNFEKVPKKVLFSWMAGPLPPSPPETRILLLSQSYIFHITPFPLKYLNVFSDKIFNVWIRMSFWVYLPYLGSSFRKFMRCTEIFREKEKMYIIYFKFSAIDLIIHSFSKPFKINGFVSVIKSY